MSPELDAIDRRLLDRLQRGISLQARPFSCLGTDLGVDEQEVLRRARGFFTSKLARRFGAVFDSRRLGYRGVLCASEVPAGRLEEVAARVGQSPCVTHSYEREGEPNFWFTVTEQEALLEERLEQMRRILAPSPLLSLPALRRFKVQVVFSFSGQNDEQASSLDTPLPGSDAGEEADPPTPLIATARDRRVVYLLQGEVPLAAEPFAGVATAVGMDVEALLALLRRWQQASTLRRIGLILYHRQAGYTANGMCVWDAPPEKLQGAGQALAARPEVTHCYERARLPAFPYNLYAMIHGHSREEVRDLQERLGRAAGLEGGRPLFSRREFKKSSPRFFPQEE